MAEVIIPVPGKVYNENLAQGSDGNLYVKQNGIWIKLETGGSENYTNIDCSTNPLCPVAKKGDKFIVTKSGKFGGNNGPIVDVGDVIICYNDNNEQREWQNNDPNFVIVEKNLGDIASLIENTTITKLKTNGNLRIVDGNLNVDRSITTQQSILASKIYSDLLQRKSITLNLTDNYAFTQHYHFIKITSQQAVTVTLADLSQLNESITTYILVDSQYNVTIQCYEGQTIDKTSTSITITGGTLGKIRLFNIGTNWYKII